MHPGGLRALEFDRIVAAVRSFALTPTGAARLARLEPETDVAAYASLSPPRRRPSATWRTTPSSRCGRTDDLPELLGLLRRRPGAEAAAPPGAGRLPRVHRDVGGRGPPRLRCFPAPSAGGRDCASFRKEMADVRGRIAASGDVVDHASPRAGLDSRPAAPPAHRSCARRSRATCAARTPRSTCRTRSSPSGTAASCCW